MEDFQFIDVVDDGTHLVFSLESVPTERSWYTSAPTPLPAAPGGTFQLRHSQRVTSGVSVGGVPVSGRVSPFPLSGRKDRVKRISARVTNILLPNAQEQERLQIQVSSVEYDDGTLAVASVYPCDLERVPSNARY